jgi:predicted secreted protein
MRRLLLLLATLICSGSALAADRPEIVQAGFSPGGHYHLLLTAYDADGSGFPVAALQITDVRRNVVVYSVRKTWNTDEGVAAPGDPAAALKTSQAAVLARYGLLSPVSGQRLFMTVPLPMLAYPPDQPAYRATPLGLLTLTPLPLRSGCTYNDFPTRGFVLKLGVRVLQRDSRLPASRECASGYSLDTAWTYRGRVAVIVRSYAQAFEGPDVMPLVVTGRLRN